jgi:hypothetical protein
MPSIALCDGGLLYLNSELRVAGQTGIEALPVHFKPTCECGCTGNKPRRTGILPQRRNTAPARPPQRRGYQQKAVRASCSEQKLKTLPEGNLTWDCGGKRSATPLGIQSDRAPSSLRFAGALQINKERTPESGPVNAPRTSRSVSASLPAKRWNKSGACFILQV